MSSSVLRVEKSHSIATVTLNRPEAMNALSAELRLALGKAFRNIQENPAIMQGTAVHGVSTLPDCIHCRHMLKRSRYQEW